MTQILQNNLNFVLSFLGPDIWKPVEIGRGWGIGMEHLQETCKKKFKLTIVSHKKTAKIVSDQITSVFMMDPKTNSLKQ